MTRLACALLMSIAAAAPVAAQQSATRTWVDSHGTTWTEVTTTRAVVEEPRSQRIAKAIAGLPRFGPFAVVDSAHAALVGEIDDNSPSEFREMLQAHPGIRMLELVDCPGTSDDGANLTLGRLIRRHGIGTDVPSGGSVRSGGFEIFLAGTVRHAAPDAEFGVHAWKDEDGHQPDDFAPDAGPNKTYLDYYREMGLSEDDAEQLYALTNSVPNEQMLWLHTKDIRPFVKVE
ncbi:hypothetical protein NSE01_12770 [Novosphingobium sediminis]|uniref:Alpha/beta hydrolase n=1 Tax=Novosphingobium sediminis TaxID=707214 RepID=A0A512AIB4_9SPHN|nr:hypothetical protein [Novosphingobium sediminis]GEN99444.1 hypothetical protein NSE01_12770 [Novosphingobium sediminis]